MSNRCAINVDLADVWRTAERDDHLHTLAWGDAVTVVATTAKAIEVELTRFEEKPDGSVLPVKSRGFIAPTKSSKIKTSEIVRPLEENTVLKVNFVDVQQGDGAVIESPDGKVILIDGGDNPMFARYLAGRFRGTSLANPKRIDCILVTHGDADHFAGLPEILESETNPVKRKRLFIDPERCYHNGIIKGPDTRNGKKVPDLELLGPTKKVGKQTYLVGLQTNLLEVPDGAMNRHFQRWKQVLEAYNQRRVSHGRSPIEFRRLQYGDAEAFSFFNREGMKIEVLGPLVRNLDGTPALEFLGDPPKGPRIGHESLSLDPAPFTGHSASHTINGHSVVFRLTYGAFSYLFTGDLNDEAGRFLTSEHQAGHLDLRADVFKVPHHGSAEFSGAFFQAVSPLVSVVSSGDENAQKEYIHPRATLMGALGKWSRLDEPLIFVTELVAFMKVEGYSVLAHPKTKQERERGEFFGFSRTAYGMVKTRTDGRRLLVYTDSGNVQLKEAYAFSRDGSGAAQPALVRQA